MAVIRYRYHFTRNNGLLEGIEQNIKSDRVLLFYHTYGKSYGVCDLRIGHNEKLYYGGNIGYSVDEKYRGHHYAGKACLLLLELARKHELDYVIITCNPNNYASRKTCEYAGGKLLEVVELPEDNDMRQESGETEKCIFRFEL